MSLFPRMNFYCNAQLDIHCFVGSPDELTLSLHTFITFLEFVQKFMFFTLSRCFSSCMIYVLRCLYNVLVQCNYHFCSLYSFVAISFGPSVNKSANILFARSTWSIMISRRERCIALCCTFDNKPLGKYGCRTGGAKTERKFWESLNSCVGLVPKRNNQFSSRFLLWLTLRFHSSSN